MACASAGVVGTSAGVGCPTCCLPAWLAQQHPVAADRCAAKLANGGSPWRQNPSPTSTSTQRRLRTSWLPSLPCATGPRRLLYPTSSPVSCGSLSSKVGRRPILATMGQTCRSASGAEGPASSCAHLCEGAAVAAAESRESDGGTSHGSRSCALGAGSPHWPATSKAAALPPLACCCDNQQGGGASRAHTSTQSPTPSTQPPRPFPALPPTHPKKTPEGSCSRVSLSGSGGRLAVGTPSCSTAGSAAGPRCAPMRHTAAGCDTLHNR